MKFISLIFVFMISAIIVDGNEIGKTEDAGTLSIKIKNMEYNPINYDGVIIDGDLNFSEKHTIESRISFKNSIFNGYVDLRNIYFTEPVIFRNVTFKDNVDISGAHFSKESEFSNCLFERNITSKKIKGDSTTFERAVVFSNSNFKGIADFTEVQFEHNAFFDSTIFRDAIFSPSRFKGFITDFGNSTFQHSANFNRAVFEGMGSVIFKNISANKPDFSYCTFSPYVTFEGSRFENNTKFNRCKYINGCDFKGSIFKNISFFNYNIFQKKADFYGIKFLEDIAFANSIFKNETSFQFANFSGHTINFEDVQFLGYADFGRSEFKGNAIFSKSNFKNDAYFYKCKFNNLDFGETKFSEGAFFEDCHVDGKLNLIKAEYDKLFIRVDNIKELKYDETAYISLIGNFKKIGFFNDAYSCYYLFMKAYAHETLLGFKGIATAVDEIVEWESSLGISSIVKSVDDIFLSIYFLLAWLLYGFGTKPDLTLIWSTFLIIVFGVLWYLARQKNTQDLNNEYSWNEYWNKENQRSELKEKITIFIKSFIFSAAVFLSGTKFFIDPPIIPASFDGSSKWVNNVYSIERFLGGIFSLLFIIAMSSIILSM